MSPHKGQTKNTAVSKPSTLTAYHQTGAKKSHHVVIPLPVSQIYNSKPAITIMNDDFISIDTVASYLVLCHDSIYFSNLLSFVLDFFNVGVSAAFRFAIWTTPDGKLREFCHSTHFLTFR